MPSPFVYEEPVAPTALIDRSAELALLADRLPRRPPTRLTARAAAPALRADRLADARNSRLEGPRRFGKTSLVRAVLAAADREGAVTVEVNFLGCVTAADVAQRIERAYAARMDGRLRRWYDG